MQFKTCSEGVAGRAGLAVGKHKGPRESVTPVGISGLISDLSPFILSKSWRESLIAPGRLCACGRVDASLWDRHPACCLRGAVV